MGVRVQLGGKIPEDGGRAQRQRDYQTVFKHYRVRCREYKAQRIYNRYMKQEGGIPYALRFKALMKTWGIYL